MGVLVLFCAAVACTGAAFAIPNPKNIRVRQLARAYWVVTAVLVAAGLASRTGMGAFIHLGKLAEHAALGILLVALVLAVWTVYCLFNGFGRNGDDR